MVLVVEAAGRDDAVHYWMLISPKDGQSKDSQKLSMPRPPASRGPKDHEDIRILQTVVRM